MRLYNVLFIGIIGMGLLACSGSKETEKENETGAVHASFVGKIKTKKSTLCNQEKEISLTGKVISDPDKTIRYVPLISGVVERTYFSLGDKVTKGQPLLDIRSSELSSLQSERIALESEVQIAGRELKTAEGMFTDNMISERELLEAQSRLKQAEASLIRVQSDMILFGSHKEDGTFSLKAPMSGYIIEKNVSSGTPVSSDGEAMFMIADLSDVWIVVDVYASDLLFVREGMEAAITAQSYPNEVFPGKVSAVSQVFDPEDKTLKARIVLPNKDLKFKPEMVVRIRLKDETQKSLVCIPSEALIFVNNSYYVVVEDNENDFSIREVLLQGHHGDITYLASGLESGENVVTRNQLLIYSECLK